MKGRNLMKVILFSGFVISCLGAVAVAQTGLILNPSNWLGPIPGDYQLSPVSNPSLCMGFTGTSTTVRQPYLTLQPCPAIAAPSDLSSSPTAAFVSLVVVPHPDGGHRLTVRGACATVARGVVFGPPAIDVLPCNVQASGTPALDGALDQRFTLVSRGPSTFELRTQSGKCVVPQGGPRELGTQLIEADCIGRTDLAFTLTSAGPVMDQRDRDAMALFGWTHIGEASRIVTNPTARFVPNRALATPTYTTLTTHNDAGRSCAIACLSDARCKGFNWSKPASPTPLLCELKDTLAPTNANAALVTGQVRP